MRLALEVLGPGKVRIIRTTRHGFLWLRRKRAFSLAHKPVGEVWWLWVSSGVRCDGRVPGRFLSWDSWIDDRLRNMDDVTAWTEIGEVPAARLLKSA